MFNRFVATSDDSTFIADVARHVRQASSAYIPAGKHLGQRYTPAAMWQREVERVERNNRAVPPHYPQTTLREKREVETPLHRFRTAFKDVLVELDSEQMFAVPIWETESHAILLLWLLTDEQAHTFRPHLCDLQKCKWGADGQSSFSARLWSQEVFSNNAVVQDFLKICRRVWAVRPHASAATPPAGGAGGEVGTTKVDDAPEQAPALTNAQRLTLRTLADFDPSILASAEMIAGKMDPGERLSDRTIRPAIAQLVTLELAERPEGDKQGARLTMKGRRLASKIAD